MTRTLKVTLGLALAVAMAGCSQRVSEPEASPEVDLAAARPSPELLYRSERGGSTLAPQSVNEDGFTSPLFGLATAPNGDLLVADAGAGIVALDGGDGVLQTPLAGASGVSPLGRGAAWVTTAALGDPTTQVGQGLHRTSNGTPRLIADLFAFEDEVDPDAQGVDSNPFDVHSLGGNAALVVDSGGNDLLRVSNQGDIDVLAIFPNEPLSTANLKDLAECPSEADVCGLPDEIPGEAVPTSVAVGPDGYYYVGELKGFPAPVGASNIWRVAPDASWAVCGASPDCEKVFDGGFTSIIDLAFDADGTLLVAELDEASWVAIEIFETITGGTVNACDLVTASCTEVATGIPMLTAITVGDEGTVWATENALIPELADVIEVP